MAAERNLAARAHRAADLDDIKDEALSCLGGARHAGVDPDATRGLVGCAVACGATSRETYNAGTGWTGAHPTEDVFLDHVNDIEDEIITQLAEIRRLASETARRLETAEADLDAASDDLAAARSMPVNDPCTGCHGRKETAVADAKAGIADAQRRIRVCEDTAAELEQARRRLEYALARVHAVPGDVAEVYELMHDWRRRHGPQARLADDAREFHTGEA